MVKFRLLFRGSLPPDKRGSADVKQSIRRQMHPQLRAVWEQHPTLKDAWRQDPKADNKTFIEVIAADNSRCGFRFVPLAWTPRLVCAVEILILRRDESYEVFSHGDLDGRVKTLIDGLRMPTQCSELGERCVPLEGEDPFYCLLADDKQIIEFSVTADRLLVPTEANEPERDVVAIINVKITASGGGEFLVPWPRLRF